MPSSVLIILAAVVTLIAVVVYGGMRYLRSDDDGDFDDLAADHGPGSGLGSQGSRDRRLRGHDDFDPGRDLPRPAARTAVSRDRARQQPGQRRDRRGGRDDYGDYGDDDRTDLLQVGDGASRSRAAAGGTDTGRLRTQPRDAERDDRDFGRAGAGRRDGRGRGPAAKPDTWDTRERGDSDIRSRRDGRPARSGAVVRELAVAGQDAPDRRGTPTSAGRTDRASGHGATDRKEELLPQVKPRPGKTKGKRDADGDWPSNEWDELSDVDYWTELAADKPFSADAPAASRRGRSERGAGRPGRDSGAGRDSVSRHVEEPLLTPVPADRAARDRSEDRAPSSGRGERMDALGPVPRRSEPVRPQPVRSEAVGSEPLRSQPVRSQPRAGRPGPDVPDRPAASFDDDPLTSPSFPRIAADDSRSYRRSRSGTHERPAVGAQPEYAAAPTGYDQPTATYDRPTATYDRPGAGPRERPAGGGYGYSPAAYLPPAADQGGLPPSDGYESTPARHRTAVHAGYDPDGIGTSGHGAPSGRYEPGPAGHGTVRAGHETVPAGYGGGSPGYGAAHDDTRSSGYGTGGDDRALPAHGLGADPQGYAGYPSGGRPEGGQVSASAGYDPLSPGYGGQYQSGYAHVGQAESAYPYQPGLSAPYQASAGPTAPYHFEPQSAQPGHQGEPGGYAGADPYAVDPYGYSAYGNRSY